MFNWTESPVENYIIDRVEEIERSENQPIMTNGYPILKWDPGVPKLDDDEYENENSNSMGKVAYDVHV